LVLQAGFPQRASSRRNVRTRLGKLAKFSPLAFFDLRDGWLSTVLGKILIPALQI